MAYIKGDAGDRMASCDAPEWDHVGKNSVEDIVVKQVCADRKGEKLTLC